MDCSHSKWTNANSVFRFMTLCEVCETTMLGVWNVAQCSDCGRYLHDSCAAALKLTFALFKTAESSTDATVAPQDDGTVTAAGRDVIVGLAEESTRGSENSVSVHAPTAAGSDETATGHRYDTGRRGDSAERAEPETVGQTEGGVSAGTDASGNGLRPVITAAAESGRSCPQTPSAADLDQAHADGGRPESNRVCDGPKVWNPVRVGPPLLIPVGGGPITITPPHDGRSEFDPIYYGLEISEPTRADPPPIWNAVRVGPPLLVPIDGGPIWVTPLE